MELRDYLRILRNRWVTILVATMVFLLAALLYVALAPKTYRATAKAFVSISPSSSSTDSANTINAGAQFVLGQMKSYTQLSDSGQVLQPVLTSLRLRDSVGQLAGRTTVSNPADTAFLLVSATDPSAARAAEVANATAASLATVIKNQQAGVGQRSYLNVDVTTEASAPGSPVSPAQNLDLLLGLVVGLAVGLTIATILERLDRSVRTAEQFRDQLGETPLAVIPPIGDPASVPFAVLDDRATRTINAYRSVRVALALANRGTPPARIVIASADSGDGRSAFASNLAISTAEGGLRVCLVEADMFDPAMAAALDIGVRAGLCEVLTGHCDLEDAVYDWHGLLSVLTIGNVDNAPAGGITGARLRAVLDELSTRYDMVIIDTPSLAVSADALVIAQYPRGRHSRTGQDGVVVIGRVGRSRPEELRWLREVMTSAGAHVMGTVLVTVPAGPWQRSGGPNGADSVASLTSRRLQELPYFAVPPVPIVPAAIEA